MVVCFQAIAAAFACDQQQYNVVFITHSEHKVNYVVTKENYFFVKKIVCWKQHVLIFNVDRVLNRTWKQKELHFFLFLHHLYFLLPMIMVQCS